MKRSKLSKSLLLVAALVAVGAFAGPRIWWRGKWKDTLSPRLAVIEAKAKFGELGAPQIGGVWKNFGTERAGVLSFWVVATDRNMSKTFVCSGDSASPIEPKGNGGFWVEFTPTNVPPWPELVMVMEARYEGRADWRGQTQRWVGVLGKDASVRTNASVWFESLNDSSRERFLSNSQKLIEAKVRRARAERL